MADPVAGAIAARELLEKDATLRKRIFLRAYSLTRSLADARELAQEAMTSAIDPAGSPWDPDTEPDLLFHVGSLMNSAAANRRRGERRHPFIHYKPEKDLRLDPAPTAEDLMVQEDDVAELERRMADLRDSLAGDDIALGKIDLLYRGIEDAASQAKLLGCSVTDIRRATERIAYQVNLIHGAVRKVTAISADSRPSVPEPTPSESEVGP